MFNTRANILYTMDKQKILDDFVAKWSNLPPQRSPQWLADRTYSIGASEMGTVLNFNPYQNVRELIERHSKITEIGDRTAMNWGNVMEPVITSFTEVVFDCTIVEMGSVPTAGAQSQRCSPDGVALVKMLGNLIVSFEFKAPARRMPCGHIPPYYEAQVLACLCAVVPADLGLFVDVVIRRCATEDWTFQSLEYCKTYHRSYTFDNVVAKSMLYFYSTTDDDVKGDPVNYGECPPKDFDLLLSNIAEAKTIKTVYGKVYTKNHDDIPIIDELKQGMNENCIGYLPVKIMKVEVIPVKKDPGYVTRLQDKIDIIIDTIRTVCNAPQEERKSVLARECDKHNFPIAVRRKWGK
jgi:hypothetical protein